jgi:DinB superfamily
MRYGHQTIIKTLEGLSLAAWETKGVVGVWSVKDIMAHLTSYELVLVEVLQALLDKASPTPTLEHMAEADFNDQQVAHRQTQTVSEIVAEYETHHAKAMELAQQIPLTTFRQHGVLPWYGAEYDLEDFIVYTFYGHKREHAAQIARYKKRLNGTRG